MSYYKVPVYGYKKGKNMIAKIDKIIVRVVPFGIEEVVTDRNLAVIPFENRNCYLQLRLRSLCEDIVLFVKKEDICSSNIASYKEISEYLASSKNKNSLSNFNRALNKIDDKKTSFAKSLIRTFR